MYEGSGLLASETDPDGHATVNTYNSRGQAWQVSAGNGLAVTLSGFDDAGRVNATRSAIGSWTNFLLDSVGNAIQTTDPTNAISRAVFNLDGEMTDAFNELGRRTSFSFNNRGWVYSTLDARGNTWGQTFDEAGNVLTSTDGRGKTTTNTWNDNGQLATTTDANTNQFQLSYWGDGSVQNETDARGLVTRHVHDLLNRQEITTLAYGLSAAESTTEVFDNTGFRTAIINALSQQTSFIPNAVGRLYQVEDDNSTVRGQYAYADAGNATSFIDGESQTTTFAVNALNEQISATDPNNDTTQDILNAEGEQVGAIDGAGDVTQQVVDPRGQVIISRDANGGLTLQTYDPAGNRISLTDPVGNTTRWAYDENNNVIKETDPLGHDRLWTYNADNQVASYTDRDGRYKEYTYYDNGQLYTETWKTSPSGSTVNTITWTYNENGAPLTVTDNAGTITWAYDDLNRLDSYEDVWGNSLSYSYYVGAQLQEVDDSFGGSMVYTWNNIGQLEQRSFTDGTAELAVGYQYNGNDQVTEVDRYTDAAATTLVGKTLYGIDNGGRVTSISHKNASNTVLDSFNYTLDTADRVTQETSTLGPTQNYVYDRTSQLLSDSSTSYSFDLNGNRTMTGYTTGTGNRLSSDGVWNYDYDDEGNTIQKTNISTGELWLFTYDHNNRLTKAEHKPSSSGAVDLRIEFGYDALGNRIQRAYDADGDGSGAATTEKYAVDPDGKVWADLTSTGSLTERRLYADAVDALFARIGSSGEEDWYLDDRLGSIRDIADHTGALIDHRDYESFGKLSYESNPSHGDRFGFTSKQAEADLGMQLNGTRYYQFDIGLWTTEDTIGFEGGSANLREYVGNNPVNCTDPTGTVLIANGLDSARDIQTWLAGEPLRIATAAVPISGNRFVILPTDLSRLRELRWSDRAANRYVLAMDECTDLMVGWLGVGGRVGSVWNEEDPTGLTTGDYRVVGDLYRAIGWRPSARPEGGGVVSDPGPLVLMAGGGLAMLRLTTPRGPGAPPSAAASAGAGAVAGAAGAGPIIINGPAGAPAGPGPIIINGPAGAPAGPGPVIINGPAGAPAGPGPIIINGPAGAPAGPGPVIINGPAGVPPAGGVGAAPQRFTPNQDALIQLARDLRDRGGVPAEVVPILREWAQEVGLPFRGPEVHPGRPIGQFPHIHVGPIGHIRVR